LHELHQKLIFCVQGSLKLGMVVKQCLFLLKPLSFCHRLQCIELFQN